jgi:hypothetical protein
MSAYIGAAHPLQVYVEEAIGAGQQTGSFGRRVLAQLHDNRDRCNKQQKPKQNGKGPTESHVTMGRNDTSAGTADAVAFPSGLKLQILCAYFLLANS